MQFVVAEAADVVGRVQAQKLDIFSWIKGLLRVDTKENVFYILRQWDRRFVEYEIGLMRDGTPVTTVPDGLQQPNVGAPICRFPWRPEREEQRRLVGSRRLA